MRRTLIATLYSLLLLLGLAHYEAASAEEHLDLYAEILENNPFPSGAYDYHAWLYNQFNIAASQYSAHLSILSQTISQYYGGYPPQYVCGQIPEEPLCIQWASLFAGFAFFSMKAAEQYAILAAW